MPRAVSRHYLLRFAPVFALGALLLAGCKPRLGGSCKVESREVCSDPKHALACIGAKWSAIDCKGEKGCKTQGNASLCDQSLAAAGDACSVSENHTCGEGSKVALSCKKGKWERAATCAGPRGCTVRDRDVECDNSIARNGDPCTVEGDVACADGAKSTLVCRAGTFEARLPCRGPSGCAVNSSMQVVCDDSNAETGDACDHVDHFSCSSDGKSVLRCDGKKFVHHQDCRIRTACKVQADGVTCAGAG